MLTEQITKLVHTIYLEEFYLDILERLCVPYELTTNPNAIGILNEFWARLPDSKAIRTPAFFELCDFISTVDEPNYNEGM